MRSIIVALFCMSVPAMATTMEMVEVSKNTYGGGVGVEGRLRDDVNPEVKDTQVLPQFFAQFRNREHLGLSLEGSYEGKDSESGALQISTRTYQLGVWGRYGFREPLRWTPFASVGAGYFLDQVTSSYGEESDTRAGRRGFVGLGGGISHALWEHLLLEGELKTAAVQDRKDPSFSAILRVGAIL